MTPLAAMFAVHVLQSLCRRGGAVPAQMIARKCYCKSFDELKVTTDGMCRGRWAC